MKTTSFQQLFGISQRVEIRINVTNACNLHCDFCDHDAHLPFNKTGPKHFRRKPLVATPELLERFCEALSGVGEQEPHVLQGGEITVLPVSSITRMIGVLRSYGRRIGMRTNGYNLTGIPLDSLNELNFIYLNAHGNNQGAIDHCREFLARNYQGEILNEEHYHHRDLRAFLNHGQGTVAQALDCSHLLSTLTLLPPIIHPCCNSWALMNALNDANMAELLVAAGWTLDNPDLKETLADWRRTLPRPFLERFCANSCYLTASGIASPLVRIQPHRLDRVLKRWAVRGTGHLMSPAAEEPN